MLAQVLLAGLVTAAGAVVVAPPVETPCVVDDESIHSRVDELQCVTGWLERNAQLGRSKDAGERKAYEKQRKRAKALLKTIDGWVASAEDRSTPTVSDDAKRRSQQHYLSGIIFFQKADYAKARDEWRLARELDPSNADATAGLERLARLYGQ